MQYCKKAIQFSLNALQSKPHSQSTHIYVTEANPILLEIHLHNNIQEVKHLLLIHNDYHSIDYEAHELNT